MTCAKLQVKCTIVAVNGKRYVGTNDVRNPHTCCPRLADEGYAKCKALCDQPGHAEVMACEAAGPDAQGAIAYIEGHYYVCDDCCNTMMAAGIANFHLGPPPPE